MQRFAFELDRVLKFKRHLEWLAEVKQHQAAAVWQAAQADADGLQGQLNQVCGRLQEMLGKAQNATSWLAIYRQSARLEHTLQAAKLKVEHAANDHALAAAARQKAATEVEVLEVLRQQKWQAHRKAFERSEQERLDDIGLRRWQTGRDHRLAAGEQEGAES